MTVTMTFIYSFFFSHLYLFLTLKIDILNLILSKSHKISTILIPTNKQLELRKLEFKSILGSNEIEIVSSH